MKSVKISASILAADFACLGEQVKAVVAAGADYIHFDVMDHHFVPNLSFGAVVCEALRRAGVTAPIDVHLMVDNPQVYIEPFAKAGATLISFHPETVADPAATVAAIRHAKLAAGLVFNPDRPVEIPVSLARELSMILLMSVYPGFGGQAFMPEVLSKARETHAWLQQHQLDVMLAIDGGIKVDNIHQAAAAGCDYFVVGSGLFQASDYRTRVAELRAAAQQGEW